MHYLPLHFLCDPGCPPHFHLFNNILQSFTPIHVTLDMWTFSGVPLLLFCVHEPPGGQRPRGWAG